LSYKGKTECLRAAATDANDILSAALELLPKSVGPFGARATLRADHFNLNQWIDSKYGLQKVEALLKKSKGLVKLRNFLPEPVAKRVLATLQAIKEEEWVWISFCVWCDRLTKLGQAVTAAYEDPAQNNIDHHFRSSKSFANADAIFSMFKSVAPDLESSFSAGRYTTSHYIAPHDDKAYKQIGDQIYSRHIALIYYLTPDWKEEHGGALLDMEGKQEYVPEFNSCVLFSVPRWHEVKPVKAADKQRLSIFGWFLKPGKSYELNTERSY